MKRKPRVKICAVCEDTAYAKNFGALSCKSCKPFFRRNANNLESLKCNFLGKCEINIKTRRRCRRCRLDKCFAVGMKKNLILSDVEKHFRRSLRGGNIQKVRNLEKETNLNETEIEELIQSNIDSLDSETNDSIDENDMRVQLYCGSSSDTLSDHSIDSDLNEDLISEMEAFLTINEILRHSTDSYKTTIDMISENITMSRPLNHYDTEYTVLENYKILELFEVFRGILDVKNKKREIVIINNLMDLPRSTNNFYEREINNLIRAVRSMNVFQNICENDKIALVKYSCIDILMLRSSIQCYDNDNQFWTLAMDEDRSFSLKLDVLKNFKSEAFITYKNSLNEIINECGSDIIILDLLTAIALFNPNRPNIINREFVRAQQQVYLHLLQRYLTFKYRNKSETEFKSVKLLNSLINAHILGELEKKFLIENYQEQYGPLIKEVCDL